MNSTEKGVRCQMEGRKLYRSRDDQMLGGVCAGIADYFEMDASIVRMLAVVLAVIGNAAVVIAYIVMWIVVPETPLDQAAAQAPAAPAAGPTSPPPAATPFAAASATSVEPPVPAPATTTAPPSTQLSAQVQGGIRSGVVWFGVILIVFGAMLLADLVYPDLSIWGFWPATLLGLFFIAGGIHTMLTKGGDV